jgi:hypothetical protein
MKYLQIFTLGLLLVLVNFSCVEEVIRIPLTPPQTGERNVLIEEFTGVRCVNCPQGTDEIINLQSIYGKNLIAVAIHAGFFSVKYNDSKFDFKTEDGQKIESWLGSPIGYPAAVVNRRSFPGEVGFQTNRQQWAGYIAQEASKAPKVKVAIFPDYNADSRELKMQVEVEAQEDINQDLRLTVMLTENNIIDPQANTAAPGGRTTDYVHKHVLRHLLTNFDGNTIGNNIRFREKVSRSFTFTIPDEEALGWWKADDMKIVAFVTQASTSVPGEVLNAAEVSIK